MILRRVVFVELLQRCDFTFSLEGTISLLSREYVQSKQGIGVVFSQVGTGNSFLLDRMSIGRGEGIHFTLNKQHHSPVCDQRSCTVTTPHS